MKANSESKRRMTIKRRKILKSDKNAHRISQRLFRLQCLLTYCDAISRLFVWRCKHIPLSGACFFFLVSNGCSVDIFHFILSHNELSKFAFYLLKGTKEDLIELRKSIVSLQKYCVLLLFSFFCSLENIF